MSMTVTLTIDPTRADDLMLLENARGWVEGRRRIECDVWETMSFDDKLVIEFAFVSDIDAEDFRTIFVTRCGRWSVGS